MSKKKEEKKKKFLIWTNSEKIWILTSSARERNMWLCVLMKAFTEVISTPALREQTFFFPLLLCLLCRKRCNASWNRDHDTWITLTCQVRLLEEIRPLLQRTTRGQLCIPGLAGGCGGVGVWRLGSGDGDSGSQTDAEPPAFCILLQQLQRLKINLLKKLMRETRTKKKSFE